MSRFDRQTAAAFGDTREFFGATLAAVSSAKRPTVAANLSVVGKGSVKLPAAAAAKPVSTAKPGDARAQAALKAAAAAGPQNVALTGLVSAKPVAAPAKPTAAAKPTTTTALVSKSFTTGKAAPIVQAATAAAAKKTTAAVAKITVVPPPKPVEAPKPVQAPKPAASSAGGAVDVRQANFLDPGAGPLTTVTSQSPTDAAKAKANENAELVRKLEIQRAAEATATRNAQYFADTAEREKADREFNRKLAEGPAGKAGIDLGLIPMGIKVLGTAAAVVATGGALAGAIGITTGGATLAAAGAADQLVAAVERGGEVAKEAKAAIDTVKDAAKKGDAAAKAAVKVINEVTDERKLKGIASGAVQTITDQAKQAVGGVMGAVVGGLNVNAVIEAANVAASKPGVKPAASLPVSATFSQAQKDGKLVVSKPPSAILDALVSPAVAPAKKLWLVTDGGKVLNLEAQPSSASSRGWAVYSNGKVVHQ